MHTPLFTLRDTHGTLHLCWQESADGCPYIGSAVHTIAEFDAASEEFADPIVRAVNSHEDLVKACEAAVAFVEADEGGLIEDAQTQTIRLLNEALAKARDGR